MAKANKLQMVERERQMLDMMERGVPRAEIIRIIARDHKIAEGTVKNHYAKLCQEIGKAANEDREATRARLIAQAEAVFRKAVDKDALKSALDAINTLSKLSGVNEKVESEQERAKVITYTKKDMSAPLEVVPPTKKAEGE